MGAALVFVLMMVSSAGLRYARKCGRDTQAFMAGWENGTAPRPSKVLPWRKQAGYATDPALIKRWSILEHSSG